MKEQAKCSKDPVIIGGVGGSGTRVIAEMLSALGFYLGSDLNNASDNLWFTLLFKRPKWYQKNSADPQQIQIQLSILRKAMLHTGQLSLREKVSVLNAAASMAPQGHSIEGHGRGRWPFQRAWRLIKAAQEESQPDSIGWGWKEPNTHVYIDHLAANFKDMKYILTIRHGLDMAFSNNQTQLFNWGPIYGVELPMHKLGVPKASLKYWVKANQRALEAGKRLGPKKFLLVNFDQLCAFPEPEIQKIISFLNIQPGTADLEKILSIPKIPSTLGRYREHDLSLFDNDDLDALNMLGFTTS